MTKEEVLEKVSLDSLWRDYLQAGGLDESKMPSVQKKEIGKALVFARAQTLILLRSDVPNLSDEEGVEVLEQMRKDSEGFFLKGGKM